jgi:glyoxylase I family protein
LAGGGAEMNRAMNHIGLNCVDPIGIEQWYAKHFAFERKRVYLPGPDQVVVIGNGGVALELFPVQGDAAPNLDARDGPTDPGVRHLAFLVDDLDAKLAEMGDDAKITLGPLDMSAFIEGMRVAWITDPEGNIVELNQGYTDETNPPPLGR